MPVRPWIPNDLPLSAKSAPQDRQVSLHTTYAPIIQQYQVSCAHALYHWHTSSDISLPTYDCRETTPATPRAGVEADLQSNGRTINRKLIDLQLANPNYRNAREWKMRVVRCEIGGHTLGDTEIATFEGWSREAERSFWRY